MEQQRVVVVLTFWPWPVRSGITRRLDALVRSLDARYRVTVVVAAEPGAPDGHPKQLDVVRLTRDQRKRSTLMAFARGLPSVTPLNAAFYRRPVVRRRLAEVLLQRTPDVVVTHGIGGAELCRGLFDAQRTIVDIDTVDPLTFRRLARRSAGLRRLQYAIDIPLVTSWHRRRLPSFGGITVTSGRDVTIYRELTTEAELTVVANGVDLPAKRHAGLPGATMLFVGDLGYAPNSDGLRWFVREVLPLLPGHQLTVVGRGSLDQHENVRHVGFVRDLSGVWRDATALVVPIWSGGGTRLKVLEAFASGLPVISTPVGVEGLAVHDGVHFLRASTAAEFELQIRRLESSQELRDALSRAGRTFAATQQWSDTTEPLLSLVHRVAQSGDR